VEYEGGKLFLTETLGDFAGHIVITEYGAPSEGLLHPRMRRVAHAYGIPAPVRHPSLTPFYFFDALKAGAYQEAAAYLAPGIRSQIPAGEGAGAFFHNFFGDFLQAFPCGGASALLYRKENGYETKLFTAEIENGLIVNFKD